ncbi:MAG: hypothetical protein ACI8RD_012095, partial [Bacillariaceae sp.]
FHLIYFKFEIGLSEVSIFAGMSNHELSVALRFNNFLNFFFLYGGMI